MTAVPTLTDATATFNRTGNTAAVVKFLDAN